MWAKLFLDHPRSVDETYGEHLRAATFFGGRMVLGGLACLVHALIPGLLATTASGMIRTLHDRMVVNRRRVREPARPAAGAPSAATPAGSSR